MPGEADPKPPAILSQFSIDLALPFQILQAPLRKSANYQRDGHWNEKERLKYSVFITFFRKLFEQPPLKKGVRVYEMMSDMIVTRNPNQCRSHHQKMEKYRVTIDEIVASVAEKYEPSLYKQLETRYLALLKTLLDNPDKYVRTWITDKNKQHTRKSLPQELEDQTDRIPHTPHLPLPDHTYKDEKNHCGRWKEDVRKPLKKTAADYEDAEHEEQLDEQEIPKFYSEESGQMKLEEDQPPYQLPMVPSPPSPPHQPSRPQTPQARPVGTKTLLYYQQQIKKMTLKRQWHYSNAQQLYSQWTIQMQAAQLCEETIKRYSMVEENDALS